MRVRDKAYLKFLQTFDFALDELEKINSVLKSYDSDLDIINNYDLFNQKSKEKLFRVAFNEKLLEYLWLKIQKTKEDAKKFQREIERKQLGEDPLDFKRMSSIPKSSFMRQMSIQMKNVGRPKFGSNSDSDDEDELPAYLQRELTLRLKNAFSIGRQQQKKLKLKKAMNPKERSERKAELKKFNLDKFQKFRRSRRNLADEFTRKVYRQGLKYEKYGILEKIEKIMKSTKNSKKKKNKKVSARKKYLSKLQTLEDIFDEENISTESFNQQSTMITEPKLSAKKSIMMTGSAFINKVKLLNKFIFYFHPSEAKCVILSFIKQKAREKKIQE